MEKVRFINAVRVVGLLFVLTYHLFKPALPGGFLGVDIFFTFSGYLITSLIILALEDTGEFEFWPYIKKRFCRIFPALFFSILFTLPFVKLISPDFTYGIDKQIAGALSFVTNYFEILKGGTYEAQLLPHLYIHTWSLALELQYYLFWGGFCALVLFVFSKIKHPNKMQKLKAFKLILLVSSAIFTVFSYSNMQALFYHYPEKTIAYFAATSRMYPFFIGSISGILFGLRLSYKISQKIKSHTKSIKIPAIVSFFVAVLGLLILCLKVSFDNDFTYRYGFFIASILTVVLIISARILHEIILLQRKEPAIIEHLSNISYPMYLFHWPLFIIFSNLVTSHLLAAIATLALSYLFSNLLFYCIEPLFYRPIYAKAENKTNVLRKKSVIAAIICLSVASALADVDVILNKKEISDLEKEQMVGNIVQNLDKIKGLKTGVDNITEETSLQKECMPATQVKSILKTAAALDTRIKANVTIIGDSITLGARKRLLESIPNSAVDAKGSRSLLDGYNLLMDMQKSESLGEYVVISLGTNGISDANLYIEKIIDELSPGHKLVFVTPFDGHWNETWKSYKTMQYLRTLKDKYPFVTITDWAEEISKQPQLLGADKTHIGGNSEAINLFINKIVEGLNEAASRRAK